MPLPLILGIGAAIAGVAGVGAGAHGAVKLHDAKQTMEGAQRHNELNQKRLEETNDQTLRTMDDLGAKELTVLKSFEEFSKVMEMIQGLPEFKQYNKNGITLPKYNGEKIKQVSVGAGVLLGGLGGAAVGTAGGFAAAGATTAAVMALGTASTGTAIASLSGAAATNATLAALGGGALAAGGGGMALGTTILGAATLGVGLLVGGVIFSITGSSLSHKADEAWSQMRHNEKKINEVCEYLESLQSTAKQYMGSLQMVYDIYQKEFDKIKTWVLYQRKIQWWEFTDKECETIENTSLLVGLLYNMCKVQFTVPSDNPEEPNRINKAEINKSREDAKHLLQEMGYIGESWH